MRLQEKMITPRWFFPAVLPQATRHSELNMRHFFPVILSLIFRFYIIKILPLTFSNCLFCVRTDPLEHLLVDRFLNAYFSVKQEKRKRYRTEFFLLKQLFFLLIFGATKKVATILDPQGLANDILKEVDLKASLRSDYLNHFFLKRIVAQDELLCHNKIIIRM